MFGPDLDVEASASGCRCRSSACGGRSAYGRSSGCVQRIEEKPQGLRDIHALFELSDMSRGSQDALNGLRAGTPASIVKQAHRLKSDLRCGT